MAARTIRTSLLSMTVWMVIALAGALAFMSFEIYRSSMIARYQDYAGDVIDCIARTVDGDDLEQCIKTGQKSAAYDELQLLANDFKETHDLEYIYIVKPLKVDPPHNMMDVLAATTAWEREHEADTLTDLGVIADDMYPSDVAAQYLQRMDHDPTVTYFRNDTDFGKIYTAIRPIFNSAGEPIAVICGDVLIDDINAAGIKYLLAVALIMFGFSAIVLLLINHWIGRRIANPLDRLQRSTGEFEEKCRARMHVSELTMADPNIHTGDEIQALSDSVVSMVQDVQAYASDLIEKDQEIMSMKEYVSKMDDLAYHDALTGAGNKAAYEKAVGRLERNILAGTASFAIVMADLNFLKRINDTYGHDKGNEYIKGMYAIMREVFEDSPVFRVGGDEFVAIVQGDELARCSQLVNAMRLRARATNDNSSLKPWRQISVACGFAVYKDGDDVASVFSRADAAMYEEKRRMHAGRSH